MSEVEEKPGEEVKGVAADPTADVPVSERKVIASVLIEVYDDSTVKSVPTGLTDIGLARVLSLVLRQMGL